MKKTLTFLVLCALLVCVCLTAQAETAAIQLPEGVYVDQAFQDADGSLLINSYEGLYRADLKTGELQQELAWDQVSPKLCPSGAGDMYAVYDVYGEEKSTLVFAVLKDGKLETLASTTPQLSYFSVDKVALVDGRICALVWGDEGRSVFSYRPGDKEVQEHGAYGDPNSGLDGLFEDGGMLCSLESSEQTSIYRFDLEKNRGAREKLSIPESTYIYNVTKAADGTYYAMARNQETDDVTIQSGKSLSSLTALATITNGNALIPVEGDCLLVDSQMIYSYKVLQNAKTTLVVSGYSSQFDSSFLVEKGIAVKSVYLDVAEVLNTKNSDVDILAFDPSEPPTLSTIKRKGYFVDLSQSEVLRGYAERMYENLSRHLYTEDGKLAAFLTGVDPLFMSGLLSVLEENGLEYPQTIGEMLDQIKILADEGVFGETYMPMDMCDYDRYSVAKYVMKRFLFEQDVARKKVDFDNQELRALLEKVVTDVPVESPYDYADDMVYYLLGYGGFPDTDAQLSLRIGSSSTDAVQTYARVLIVNPYSKHQAEAIAYLEYCMQKEFAALPESEYLYFADKTEPLVSSYMVKQMEELNQELKELEGQEATVEVKDRMAAIQEELKSCEEYKYAVSPEQLAAWKNTVQYLAIPEENLYSDQLDTLVKRLADGNMPVDDFLKECNKYIQMVYMERDE